jgi:hypothetical protein
MVELIYFLTMFSVDSVVYNGLQDLYGDAITEDSTLVMDATLHLGIVRVTTIRYKLADMIDFPICSAFAASNYNKYGNCPADGRYTFNLPFDFPAPRSSFSEWAASGYEGEIYMKIYFGSDLVGQCVVQASTIGTKATNKPSGKIVAVVIASIVGLLLSYITARFLGAYCAKKVIEMDAKNVDSEMPEELAEPTTTYNRFEGGAIYDANHAVALVPLEGPTRSFANGPLI